MFEKESNAVRLGIEFLQALNEKDYLLDPTFDPVDLESRLDEIQDDINFLISNLPVEAIDDDEEREAEYEGDFEDSEELEDEVVECEKLIAQATELLESVREHYLPSGLSDPLIPVESMLEDTNNPEAKSEPAAPSYTPIKPVMQKKKFKFKWDLFFAILILGILFASLIYWNC